jgi:Kef-type K+ transport system membrane component KefB
MESATGWPLVIVGGLLLVGFLAHELGRRAHVPRVTLLLLLGVIAGPSGLGLLPESVREFFPLAAEVTLSMVGFMLGEQFFGKNFRKTGRIVLGVSVAESLGAAVCVLIGLLLAGAPLPLALLLAGIGPASAPAATVDVIRESKASGPLTDTVLGVVAIDDAFGILLFSLFLVVAEAWAGSSATWVTLAAGGWEIMGAVVVGLVLGLPMAWLTGRIRPGELTLVETLGFVLGCGGLANVIGVSYLLSCIVLGAVVANRSRHSIPFHAIEGISQVFMIIFFLLAGLELDLAEFLAFGALGLAYMLARCVGKLVGAPLGARAADAPRVVRTHVGWCLLPQAGVALGLALVAGQRFPELAPGLLSLLVATTFLFEVLGPISTRLALHLSVEAGSAPEE